MGKQLLIKDTLTNQLSYYHILLFLACLPLDRFFSELVFVSLVAHTLINLKSTDLKLLLNPRILILQSVFFVTVFSTLYAPNLPKALNDWAMQAHILLVPVVFALHQPLISRYKAQLLTGFAYSCTLVTLFLFGTAMYTIAFYHLPFSRLYSASFINHNFSAPVGIHATFFSMLLVASAVILFCDLVSEAGKLRKTILLLSILVLLGGLIQLSAKSAIIPLLIMAYVFVPLYILNGKKRLVLLAVSVLITIVGSIIILKSDYLKQRLFTDLETDVDLNRVTVVTDSRLDRWQAALATIVKKPILGYGAGTEQGLMEQTYFKQKLYHSYLHKLNAHNQFLSLLVKSGLLGLLVYLGTLGYGFRVAFRKRDLLLTTLIILIISVSIAENVLDANKGILFYSAFFSIALLTVNTSPRAQLSAKKVPAGATLAQVSTC